MKKINSKIMEEIKEIVSQQGVESLDQLQEILDNFLIEKNNTGIDCFLGLSPTQMSSALYLPFSLSNHIFNFKVADESQLEDIPIIKQAHFILGKLSEIGEMKGTQLGNFPKSFVLDFYNLFLSRERYARIPNREEDIFQLTRLKHLLELSGMIKKRNNKFSLTKKGEKILIQHDSSQLYETLFKTWAETFNWAMNDRISELDFIQQSVIFNLYLLHKLCNDWVEDEEVAQRYLKAFPDLVLEVESSFFGPDSEVVACFTLRFLDRFCLPLGLLEQKEEGEFFEDRKVFYRATSFFKENFIFFVPSERLSS